MYVGGSIIGSVLVMALMGYLMLRAYRNTKPYDSRVGALSGESSKTHNPR
jgi:hypothetical protein